MSGANSYSVSFSDMVDLVPDDWGYAYYTDANGNQIYTYANAPVTNAWKDFNQVWGYVDPKLTSISVTLKNASNATRARTSFTPSVSGYWGAYLWSGDTRIDIATGDRVEVVPTGGASMNVPVPGLTAALDVGADRIWGSAPANSTLHTYVWHWLGSSYSGYYYRSTASNSAGSYSASPGVDVVTCDYGETWYINPQGNRVYVRGYTNFGDGYEPDNTYSNARMIQAQGQPSANHNFHTAGDHDWYKFYANRDMRYVLKTFNLGSGSDTYLQLYDTNGTTILREDDDSGDGLASQIEWTAPTSGIYYVKVRHYSPSRVGCDTRYDLKIEGRTYTISGRVTDANGHGIPGVTVWADATHSTTTNANGDYTFTGLPAGTYNISPSRYLYAFSPSSRTVTVPPNATGQDFVQTPVVDLSVNRIEVAQVFVEENDPISGTAIPLIAEKDTLVRVYVGLAGAPSVYGVTARLHLRNAFGIEHTMTESANLWPVLVTQTPDPLRLQDTINFRPPPEWLWGTITFWADIDPENRIPETNESNNTGGWVEQPFQPGKPLRIAWTMMGYKSPSSSIVAFPSWNVAAKGDKALRRIYPVGVDDVEYFYQPGILEVLTVKFNEETAAYRKAANRFWNSVSLSSSWIGGAPDRLYAWIPGEARDSNTDCGVGDAVWDPYNPGYGRVAIGAEECNKKFAGVLKEISPDEVMAHELGHILNSQGLRHTPNDVSAECFAVPGGPGPYPTATPKGSIVAHGLDIERLKVLDPEHTYDFMTYCKPWWASPFNYQKLHAGFEAPPSSNVAEAQSMSSTRQLLVSGMVYSPTLRVELDPFYSVLSTALPSPNIGSDYCVEALAPDGGHLASRCFDLGFSHSEFGLSPETPTEVADSFALSIPYPSGTTRVVLTHLGTPIATRAVSQHAPIVRLLSPNGGETWTGSGTHTVTWTASDLDGDTLHFALAYSTDGGASWIPAGLDLTGTQHALDVSMLPGGTSVLLRVSATDGVNTTDDVSDAPFRVGRKAPQAFILSPEDSARFFPGQAIWLEGRAFDLEDGTLDDAALRWSSDRDGELGTGKLLITTLSPGEHTITLTATDSDGTQAVATIRLSAGDRVFLPLIWRAQ